MKWHGRLGLWWVPLLLFLTPLAGLAPAHRDLIDFFAPMRGLTASMLSSGSAPWLNLANGCGEAWFANPQTAVLYPPAWLHVILPGPWALAGEIGLHLALLSLGVGLLARELGASRSGRSLAEVTAWSAGPILVTVGVLNNLETLTWIPWMFLAARHRGRASVPLLAVVTALGWLGGEPQVWAIGSVLVVATARRRVRAVVGIGLGVALIAVQLVPFLWWVAEGDRGSAASWLLRGAVTPADWSGVLVPGLPASTERMVYAESLFLGAPILMCAVLGAWSRRWILAIVAAFAVLATLPEIGGGGLFIALTGGLVRYPSRFALLGLAILVPLIGEGADAWLDGRGRWLAATLSVLSLGACALSAHPWRWWLAGVPALLMLIAALTPFRRSLRSAVLIVGAVAVVTAGLPLLGVRPVGEFGAGPPVWPEASDGVRVYVPTPARDVMRWLASDVQHRRLWPVGYLNLEDGLTLARTDAPVANGRLASHIALADEGPSRRWWLDALAAGWMILPADAAVPEGMSEVARHGVMRLLRNHRALPVVSLGDRPPDSAQPQTMVGEVKALMLRENSCSATLDLPERAWMWVSLAPATGWRWRMDGEAVTLEQGPGIVQFLEVPAGIHRLEGHYRPPALVSLIVLSCTTLVGVLFWVGLEVRRSNRGGAFGTDPTPADLRREP
jgi:hypothetical protein